MASQYSTSRYSSSPAGDAGAKARAYFMSMYKALPDYILITYEASAGNKTGYYRYDIYNNNAIANNGVPGADYTGVWNCISNLGIQYMNYNDMSVYQKGIGQTGFYEDPTGSKSILKTFLNGKSSPGNPSDNGTLTAIPDIRASISATADGIWGRYDTGNTFGMFPTSGTTGYRLNFANVWQMSPMTNQDSTIANSTYLLNTSYPVIAPFYSYDAVAGGVPTVTNASGQKSATTPPTIIKANYSADNKLLDLSNYIFLSNSGNGVIKIYARRSIVGTVAYINNNSFLDVTKYVSSSWATQNTPLPDAAGAVLMAISYFHNAQKLSSSSNAGPYRCDNTDSAAMLYDSSIYNTITNAVVGRVGCYELAMAYPFLISSGSKDGKYPSVFSTILSNDVNKINTATALGVCSNAYINSNNNINDNNVNSTISQVNKDLQKLCETSLTSWIGANTVDKTIKTCSIWSGLSNANLQSCNTNIQNYIKTGQCKGNRNKVDTALGTTNTTNLGSYISNNQKILPNQYLVSQNGYYVLIMQNDGNAVLYNISSATLNVVWSTSTFGNPGAYLIFMNFNIYIYSNTGKQLYTTNNVIPDKSNASNGLLVMQNDANLVIYNTQTLDPWTATAISSTNTSDKDKVTISDKITTVAKSFDTYGACPSITPNLSNLSIAQQSLWPLITSYLSFNIIVSAENNPGSYDTDDSSNLFYKLFQLQYDITTIPTDGTNGTDPTNTVYSITDKFWTLLSGYSTPLFVTSAADTLNRPLNPLTAIPFKFIKNLTKYNPFTDKTTNVSNINSNTNNLYSSPTYYYAHVGIYFSNSIDINITPTVYQVYTLNYNSVTAYNNIVQYVATIANDADKKILWNTLPDLFVTNITNYITSTTDLNDSYYNTLCNNIQPLANSTSSQSISTACINSNVNYCTNFNKSCYVQDNNKTVNKWGISFPTSAAITDLQKKNESNLLAAVNKLYPHTMLVTYINGNYVVYSYDYVWPPPNNSEYGDDGVLSSIPIKFASLKSSRSQNGIGWLSTNKIWGALSNIMSNQGFKVNNGTTNNFDKLNNFDLNKFIGVTNSTSVYNNKQVLYGDNGPNQSDYMFLLYTLNIGLNTTTTNLWNLVVGSNTTNGLILSACTTNDSLFNPGTCNTLCTTYPDQCYSKYAALLNSSNLINTYNGSPAYLLDDILSLNATNKINLTNAIINASNGLFMYGSIPTDVLLVAGTTGTPAQFLNLLNSLKTSSTVIKNKAYNSIIKSISNYCSTAINGTASTSSRGLSLANAILTIDPAAYEQIINNAISYCSNKLTTDTWCKSTLANTASGSNTLTNIANNLGCNSDIHKFSKKSSTDNYATYNTTCNTIYNLDNTTNNTSITNTCSLSNYSTLSNSDKSLCNQAIKGYCGNKTDMDDFCFTWTFNQDLPNPLALSSSYSNNLGTGQVDSTTDNLNTILLNNFNKYCSTNPQLLDTDKYCNYIYGNNTMAANNTIPTVYSSTNINKASCTNSDNRYKFTNKDKFAGSVVDICNQLDLPQNLQDACNKGTAEYCSTNPTDSNCATPPVFNKSNQTSNDWIYILIIIIAIICAVLLKVYFNKKTNKPVINIENEVISQPIEMHNINLEVNNIEPNINPELTIL